MVEKEVLEDGGKIRYLTNLLIKGELDRMSDETINHYKDILRTQIELEFLRDGYEFSEEKIEWIVLQGHFDKEYRTVVSSPRDDSFPCISVACKTKMLSVVNDNG